MIAARGPVYRRSFAALAVVGSSTILGLAVFLWVSFRRESIDSVRVAIERIARQVADSHEWPIATSESGMWLTRYDLAGRVLLDTSAGAAPSDGSEAPAEVVNAIEQGVSFDVRKVSRESGVETLFVAVRGKDHVGRAAVSLTRLAESRVKFTWVALAAAAFSIAAAAAAARWIASSFSKSVAPIVAAAREVAEGDFRSRIRTDRPDEIGDLARAVDAVADRRMVILQQAEDERGELRAILDNAAEGIVVLGPGGRIQLINSAARRIYDAPPDATGRPFVEITRNSQVQRFLDRIRDEPGTHQIDAQIGDEDLRTVRIAGCRIPDVKRNEGRMVLLSTDVSDLRRLERLRVDFVANASHELKTPLSSILGYAETLRDDLGIDSETQHKFLDTILRNAHRLEELVADMLRLARLDSAAGSFQFAPTNIGEVVDRVIAEHDSDARVRGVRLLGETSRAVTPIVADAELVYQCISNLVGNAIKFTSVGGAVDVLVRAIDDGITIDVNDTGAGIAPEHLPRIFERFYRADTGRAREAGGTGLGLAIAKHAAAIHGGRIEVDSALGRGSRFRVFLPFSPPER